VSCNARQIVFNDAKDRRVYLELLRYYTEKFRLQIWAWCLMSNHIHLLAVRRCHVIGRDQEGFPDMSSWSASYTADRWRDTLQLGIEEEALRERLRLATLTGRPFGSDQFIDDLELTSNRKR
jgi:hypothetical protein